VINDHPLYSGTTIMFVYSRFQFSLFAFPMRIP